MLMFERFTEKAIKVVMLSQEESRRLGHNFVGTEQILLGLIGENGGVAYKVLRTFGVTLREARTEVERIIGRGSGFVAVEIPFTPRAKRVLEIAIEEARDLGHGYIGTEHVLLALLEEEVGVGVRVLQQLGLVISQIRTELLIQIGESIEAAVAGEKSELFDMGGLAIEEFTTNLTETAFNGNLDPVVGRDDEISRVIQILARRRKNNPVLIGEPGVGKTAVAEGLAQRIVERDVPALLDDKQVISLDVGLLLAGTKYRGEFEERLKRIVDEVRSSENIILVIDEVHTLIGAGAAEGAVDAANILKPALARGELQCLGATTVEEYRKHIERDSALERRFQPVQIDEPSVDDTVDILRCLRARYERHHGLKIGDDALEAAARMGAQYIADRFLPDKAIDLMDETGALLNVNRKDNKKITVNQIDIEKTISKITKIPEKSISKDESKSLKNIERDLKRVIFGQDKAIVSLGNAIKLSRAGLRDDNKTIGSFLFAGPTGVGKTELARQLASILGIELIRFDMSEYMERHTVSRLIGAPPGYVGFDQGGLLTEAIVKNPHAVLLLDEIEKANPDIFNLLLQVMDSGVLTDNNGRKADFRNVILIMTTNAGADLLEKSSIGFNSQSNESDALKSLNKLFAPEFRNRLDEIIQFNYLPKKVVLSIVDKFLTKLQAQLDEREIELIYSKKVVNWIADKGYNKHMGARPMERFITDHIKKPLVNDVLFGALNKGGQIKVDLVDGQVEFTELTKEKVT